MYEYQRILQPSRASENEQRTSSECRKSNKPLLEKKRRARINRSLDQLKTLLIDAIKNDHATGYSKLEKADILELAVKYLRNIRGQQISAVSVGESSVAARYRDGFSECAQEVDRFLASVNGLGHDTRYRLMNHLAGCVKRPQLSARRTQLHPAPPPPPTFSSPGAIYGVQLPPSSAASSLSQIDYTSGLESTASDVITSSLDGRRRSLSAAAVPCNPAAFPGFVAPSMTGRTSAACPLFAMSTGDSQVVGSQSSVFRPIQPSSPGADRCSPTDSELEMAACDAGTNNFYTRVDVDNVGTLSAPSPASKVLSGGGTGPLTAKNDNRDNIARGLLDAQKRDVDLTSAGSGIDVGVDQSMVMMMMSMHDDVKDEQVWRPW